MWWWQGKEVLVLGRQVKVVVVEVVAMKKEILLAAPGRALAAAPVEILVVAGVQLVEGSLEVRLATIWADEKQTKAGGERREIRRGKSRREIARRKKMEMREKVRKLPKTLFFQ